MHTSQAINTSLGSTQWLLHAYLADLSDADLLVRPAPTANHIAWQLSHLINSEKMLLASMLPGVKYPDIPEPIAKKGNKEDAREDTGFRTKAEYIDLFGKVRGATMAAVEKLSDADFDKPSTVMPEFAPNLGALLVLVSNHTMMHAGQFTTVRRKLGKPVLF